MAPDLAPDLADDDVDAVLLISGSEVGQRIAQRRQLPVQHGADRTAGDNTGTGGRRAQEDDSGGVLALEKWRRGVSDERIWALVALAAYAGLRLTGRERVAAYKAAGVAGILIVANACSAVWLGLTMEALPYVADHFVEVADRALGSPSWVMGRFVHEHGWYLWLITKVYTYLPVGAAVVAYFQLRRSSTEGFPRHHIVKSFILIGAIGPIVYFLFPVVGPAYAFGNEVVGAGWMNVWPHVVPTSLEPVSAYFSQAAPRNCMPSLHTAWATAILLHSLRGPRLLKLFGVFWWVCTISATLGLGAHYGVDLIAGLVFALTLEAGALPREPWVFDAAAFA